MTVKPTRAVCECGERAAASAYGLLLCIGCYVEQGFANPALLGGRPSPRSLATTDKAASNER
jgi:hypothetical protein